MPGTGTLLLLAFAAIVVVLLLLLLQLTRLGYLVRTSIPDRPRQRMFMASVAFLITFIGVRILVRMIVHGIGPFEWVMVRGTHIHHLVWGILILLVVGYGWLADLGRNSSPISIFFGRLMAISYGVGAALTLDEFAIWLNLDPDSYWDETGRLSIDAVVAFGALLAIGAWGAPFFRALERMWSRSALIRLGVKHGVHRGFKSISGPFRRSKLLRQRKFRRSRSHNAD